VKDEFERIEQMNTCGSMTPFNLAYIANSYRKCTTMHREIHFHQSEWCDETAAVDTVCILLFVDNIPQFKNAGKRMCFSPNIM